MNDQTAYSMNATNWGRDPAFREQFTAAVEQIFDSESDLMSELRSVVAEQHDRSVGPCDLTDILLSLREICERRAGIDVNENDLLTSLARELLVLAFASVNWQAIAESLAECANGSQFPKAPT